MNALISRLLQSSEPSIRYKTCLLLNEDPQSSQMLALRTEIKYSPRASALLSERDSEGRIPAHPYKKWYGAHWVLVSLAEIGYPPGDRSLIPLREQELEWLLSPRHVEHLVLQGRVRFCASMESNAIFSLLSLGLADERVDELARQLMDWQWPDGGWNCDKRPDAVNSSFMETITPLRGLSLYASITGSSRARLAVERAVEIFLKRQLFRSQKSGQVIEPDFTRLHYPLYWHYDILHALTIIAGAGFLSDPRCQDALTLLKSKQLPDGSFPAEAKFYKPTGQTIIPIPERISGYSLVNWGPVGKKMNEFVTVEALAVLKQSGMLGDLL